MMKNICAVLFLLIAAINVKAQGGGRRSGGAGGDGGVRITGKVIDSVTKQPVDYATVSIYKQGSASPFSGGVTDPKGNIAVNNISPGDYKVTVEFLGYKRKTIAHVTVGSADVSVGTVLLAPVSNQLKEVNITATAATVENKIDKIVYNPANDLTTQGGLALDVLQKVPMVSVDINGNVELMGNTNIQFLINGKPSTIFGASITDALQAIPASQIKSIEVITNPGAKYDAEGTGGIINIILKDNNIQGVNGNVNLTAGTRLENGSFNINAKKGKVGVSAFFSGNEQIQSTTPSSETRTSYSNTRDTVTSLNDKGTSLFKRSGYRSGFSLTYDITPKDQLVASINFNHFGNQSNGTTAQGQSTYANSLVVDTNSVNTSSSKFSDNSTDFSLAYKKTFKQKDQELDFLYNTSFGRNTNDYTQLVNYTDVTFPSTGSIGSNPGTDRQTDISVDYTQPVSKGVTIETGAKATIEDIGNTVSTETLDDGMYEYNPLQSYSFDYNRKIFAYYLSTTFALFNDFLDGKAGLRYEYTNSTSDFPNTIIPSYGFLAPSFVLQHKLDKTQSIKFSYSYRLQRPSYSNLNPFYNISDPHDISTGNPDLKPEYGHNFELGYNKQFSDGATVYVAGFYRYNTNDLQTFTTFYPSLKIAVLDTTYSNVSLTQNYNIGKQVTEGVNLFGSLPVGKFTFRSNMFLADRITSNPGDPQVSGLFYRLNLNTSYEFANSFAAQAFINYRSSSVGIQGTSPGFVFYSFAVRKQLFHKSASIGLTAINPFNNYVNQTTTTYGSNFNQSAFRAVPLRSFGISIMYKFGKLEFKKEKEPQDNSVPTDDTNPATPTTPAPGTGGGNGGGGGTGGGGTGGGGGGGGGTRGGGGGGAGGGAAG